MEAFQQTCRPYLPLASAFADSSSTSISSGQQPSSPSSAETANHDNHTDVSVDSLTNHVSELSTTDDPNAKHWSAESTLDSTANAGFTGHVRTSNGRIHTHTTQHLPIFKYFFPLFFFENLWVKRIFPFFCLIYFLQQFHTITTPPFARKTKHQPNRVLRLVGSVSVLPAIVFFYSFHSVLTLVL